MPIPYLLPIFAVHNRKAMLLEAIQRGLRPQHYETAIDIAEEAASFFALKGENQENLLKDLRKHETAEELRERMRLSVPVTGAALGPPLSFINRIRQAPGRSEVFEYAADQQLRTRISRNIEMFRSEQTLYDWLFTTAFHANVFDPNLWVALEAEQDESGHYSVYPVVFKSSQVLNISRNRRGELTNLVVEQARSYTGSRGLSETHIFYYEYGRGYSAVAVAAQNENGESLPADQVPEGAERVSLQPNGALARSFFYAVYENNLEHVPAFQLGAYNSKEEVDSDLKVPFYETARAMLRKMVDIGSMESIMTRRFAYPKEVRQVQACTAEHEDYGMCDAGYYGGLRDREHICGVCRGSGKAPVIGEMDTMDFILPVRVTDEELLDLTKLLYTHHPPVDALDAMRTRLDSLMQLVASLIFSQDPTQRVDMKTATAVNAAERTITNHLRWIAEKLEGAWEYSVLMMLEYNDGDLSKVDISLSHPADLVLTSLDVAIQNLKSAQDAGASASAIKTLQKAVLLRQNPADMRRVDSGVAFLSHKPFSGLPTNMQSVIAMGYSQDHPLRVLWENFDQIQCDVEDELQRNGVYFSELTRPNQTTLIDAAVRQFIERKIKPFMAPAGPEAFNNQNDEEE